MNVKWTLLANQVEAKLKDMQLKGQDLTHALDALGNTILNRVRLGFRLGRDPWGTPWQPLSIGGKRYGQQPLRDTGRLQRSITSQVQGNAVVIGTNVIYAATHQFGRKIGKGEIPARPFLPIIGNDVSLPAPWAQSALAGMAKAMGL